MLRSRAISFSASRPRQDRLLLLVLDALLTASQNLRPRLNGLAGPGSRMAIRAAGDAAGGEFDQTIGPTFAALRRQRSRGRSDHVAKLGKKLTEIINGNASNVGSDAAWTMPIRKKLEDGSRFLVGCSSDRDDVVEGRTSGLIDDGNGLGRIRRT